MRVIFFLLLAVLVTACSPHRLPPEMSSLQQMPKKWRHPEVIVVDAGHGGKDAGTSSQLHRYEEKELTLQTALLIRNSLNQLGYKVILTRSEDAFVSLDKRAELANGNGADLFVSIHYNHSSNREADGIEVFYYEEKGASERVVRSRSVGREVLSHLVKLTGAHSRGVKEANFAVIRQTKMPAILIEGGFLSNEKERKKLQDGQYRRSLALAIARGVDHYIKRNRI